MTLISQPLGPTKEKTDSNDDRTFVSDWSHTHKINPASKYYEGPLDFECFENVMNSSYYKDFEEKYKNYQWWIDKKHRIEQTIKDFYGASETLIDRAMTQTKVILK